MQVQSIYKSVEKLSRLCQSLLLLARIENKQYTVTQKIAVDELLKEKINEFEAWTSAKSLKIKLQLEPLQVTMNRDLAEILISNLIKNAVRHTEANGTILIKTGKHQFSIVNSGAGALNNNKIFDRFYKSENSEGSGIGLAIAQQICGQYQFQLDYSFDKNQHCFTVLMPS